MKPVLVATDGSPTAEEALETAIELAKLLETELIVVTAWDIPYPIVGFAPMVVNAELAKPCEDDARKAAFDAAARAEEAGVEARAVVLRGFPIEEICGAAEKFAPRFLVIGSHGWGPVKRALLGSVSSGVLHHATCPVLVVRGDGATSTNGTREEATAQAKQ
jgi:nucleotide-binding universal stress UspA family protein